MSHSRKSLSTTIRLTSDTWWRYGNKTASGIPSGGGGESGATLQLYPASALRLLDHHLHASGILPNNLNNNKNNTAVSNNSGGDDEDDDCSKNNNNSRLLYDHSWFCVNQSVTCIPLSSTLNLQQSLLGDRLAHAHIWVTKIGKSSLQLANVLTLNEKDKVEDDYVKDNDSTVSIMKPKPKVLATAQRVFVRSSPFTELEKQDLWERGRPTWNNDNDDNDDDDNNNNSDNFELAEYYTNMSLPLEDDHNNNTNDQSSKGDTSSATEALLYPPLPILERFHGMVPTSQLLLLSSSSPPILTVLIGPQHVNFANHLDHAAFVEIAVHAMWLKASEERNNINNTIKNQKQSPSPLLLATSVAINYFQEVFLGQWLECFVQDDLIYLMTRPSSSSSSSSSPTGPGDEAILVAIAKASNQ